MPTPPNSLSEQNYHDRRFQDRKDAGRQLSQLLKIYRNQPVVVYGLPRGGVPVAYEVAAELHAPLDTIVIKKISHPSQPEFAIGAIAVNGHSIRKPLTDDYVYNQWSYCENESNFKAKAYDALLEAQRRQNLYVAERQQPSVTGKIAILVDDGLATGLTMKAAIHEVHHNNPKGIIVAVPVASYYEAQAVLSKVDAFISVLTPKIGFQSVSNYYTHFPQVTDEEVLSILNQAEGLPNKEVRKQ